MRTVIGPFCATCKKEMYRHAEPNQFGYVHGEWKHIGEVHCPNPDVTWALER